ncbi:MAG: MotA/TolQ/ExbB proton channel family protein, partial [Planctomycetota bacterium]
AGLLHWEDDLQDVSTALVEAGQREADDLQKNLPALQGIASVSPLLGLLGTVTGMIQSFYTVARERSLGNPALLAEGIGEALVTTAAGLTVAIPAVILFYAFRGRTRRLARALDDIARGMLALHRERRLR